MSKFNFKEKFATSWASFRGSPIFIVVLLGIEVCWGTLHYLFGFDPDWGMLNLFLSTEASITTALLIIDLHHSDQAQRRMEAAQSRQLDLQTTQLEMQSKQLRVIIHVLKALRGQPVDDEE